MAGTLHIELNDLHVTMTTSENGTSRQNSTTDGGGSVSQAHVSQLDTDLMDLDLDGNHPLMGENSGGTLRPRPSPGAQTLPTSLSAPSLVAAAAGSMSHVSTSQEQASQPVVQPGPPQPIVQPGPPQPIVQPGSPQPIVQPGPPLPIVQPGPPQPIVQPGPPQPIVQPGPPQPIVQPGPLQPIVQPGPPQPIVQPGPLQPMVQSRSPQPMVQGLASATPLPILPGQGVGPRFPYPVSTASGKG